MTDTPGRSDFAPEELAYLGERRLGRIATVGSDGTPHVTPVGMWRYNAELDTLDIGGNAFDRTLKFRDVTRTGRAAIVIDDLPSTNPWHARGIQVRGRAEALSDPDPLIRIHPDRVISWGLGDQP